MVCASRGAHIRDSSRARTYLVAIKVRAMLQHRLIDERAHVREHQRPAERTSILHLEQVSQEHAPGVAYHAQRIGVALVGGDVKTVVWQRRRESYLLHVRLYVLDVVRRHVF